MMRAPPLRATMQRRLLVNYRVDPAAVAAILPAPFRPILVGGYGMAGICLLRLGGVRPAWMPGTVGLHSENAAHRVAVCWDGPHGTVSGVYVPRRDTSSGLAVMAGGRLFPGWQHRARFRVHEDEDGEGGRGSYRVDVQSRDGAVRIVVKAHVANSVMPGSVFASLEEASRFLCGAPVAYAATPTAGVFDGVALGTDGWGLRPLHVGQATSSFFDDPARFPPGTVTLDSGFWMGGLATTWRPQPRLQAARLAAGPPCLRSLDPTAAGRCLVLGDPTGDEGPWR